MMKLALAAVLTAAALPALAQTARVAPGQSSFESASPEVGVRGEAAANARAMGQGTPEILPNGSSYGPSNRGVDPSAGYRADTTGSVPRTTGAVEIAPNGSTYVPAPR